MSFSYKELIKQRKSVRTFDGAGLKEEHLAELEKHVAEIICPLGDIQKVDVGIGLAHFDLTRKENGLSGRFTFKDPGLKTPENIQYVVSFERD